MNKSETIGAIAKALADFQGEIKNPKQTATNPYKIECCNDYFKWITSGTKRIKTQG